MAGIYIHIPFCHRRCHYCDFYTVVNLKYLSSYYEALIKEIQIRKHFFNTNIPIQSLYIGGGTPSLLSTQIIEKIITECYKNFSFSDDVEITIEVNPEDVSYKYFFELKNLGVNRISIGIQSFSDKWLKFLNRKHSRKLAIQSLEHVFKADIKNVSVDLIFGIRGMTLKEWKETLYETFSFPITHLSVYHLIIEPKTTFYYLKNKNKLQEPSEEQSLIQYKTLNEIVNQYGFEHYEISNFCKIGFRSRHNSFYWNNAPYLGLGPSAHSFDGNKRYYNIADLRKYIENSELNIFKTEYETLSEIQKLNEMIMLRLRVKEGLLLKEFKYRLQEKQYNIFKNKIQKYIPHYLLIENEALKMTLEGWFISDSIISDLFFN